jgi:hypothetical protein
VDEVTVIEGDDRGVNSVFERHAVEVVDHDSLVGVVLLEAAGGCFALRGCGSRGLGGRAFGLRGRVRFLIQHL